MNIVTRATIKEISEQVTQHENVLRGKNGDIGLIARVKALEDALMESKWWLRGIGLLIIAELVARLAGIL